MKEKDKTEIITGNPGDKTGRKASAFRVHAQESKAKTAGQQGLLAVTYPVSPGNFQKNPFIQQSDFCAKNDED